MLQPLVVRPRDGGGYEIIAGERRFRASRLAGLDVLPVLVREMPDADVLRAMMAENVQRAALTPIEEARGYERLLEADADATADTVAAAVGRSKSWVYQRLQLLKLAAPARKAVEQGAITAGHAVELARLEEADQAAALVACQEDTSPTGRALSVRGLQRWVRGNVHLDRLRDGEAAAAAAEDGVLHVVRERWLQLPRGAGRVLAPQAYKAVKTITACQHAARAVVVFGEGQGERLLACPRRSKCATHWKDYVAEQERSREEQAKNDARWKRQDAAAARQTPGRRGLGQTRAKPIRDALLAGPPLTDAQARCVVEWLASYVARDLDIDLEAVTAENALRTLATVAAFKPGDWNHAEIEQRAEALGAAVAPAPTSRRRAKRRVQSSAQPAPGPA